MKRKTREVEKRTHTLMNAIPRFVSIVSRGANLAPLSELRYAEGETFSDVEIHQIVFSKEKFSRESVEAYLTENDYEDFSIEEDEATFIVPGLAADHFEKFNAIEYADGVKFFVGSVKKTEAVESGQATAAVLDAEVLDFQEPEAELVQEGANADAVEQAEQEIAEAIEAVAEPDLVQEGDLSVEDLQPKKDNVDEETQPQDAEVAGEEGSDEFQAPGEEATVEVEAEVETPKVFNDLLFREKALAALEVFMTTLDEARTEAFSVPPVELFTAEQVAEQVAAAVEEASAKYADNKNDESIEKPIDENVILVQNSHAVNTDEITTDSKDEGTLKFSQRRSNDLFGLR